MPTALNMPTRFDSSRKHIFTTAESIILENGIASITIDEIISKAAISEW